MSETTPTPPQAPEPERRVGAIHSSDDKTKVLNFIGYGVYLGEAVPDASQTHPNLQELHKLGITNPKLRMDDGTIIWGCECWWGDEVRIKEQVEQYIAEGYTLAPVNIVERRALETSAIKATMAKADEAFEEAQENPDPRSTPGLFRYAQSRKDAVLAEQSAIARDTVEGSAAWERCAGRLAELEDMIKVVEGRTAKGIKKFASVAIAEVENEGLAIVLEFYPSKTPKQASMEVNEWLKSDRSTPPPLVDMLGTKMFALTHDTAQDLMRVINGNMSGSIGEMGKSGDTDDLVSAIQSSALGIKCDKCGITFQPEETHTCP